MINTKHKDVQHLQETIMRGEDWSVETDPHLGWDGWCIIIFSFVVVGLMLWLLV